MNSNMYENHINNNKQKHNERIDSIFHVCNKLNDNIYNNNNNNNNNYDNLYNKDIDSNNNKYLNTDEACNKNSDCMSFKNIKHNNNNNNNNNNNSLLDRAVPAMSQTISNDVNNNYNNNNPSNNNYNTNTSNNNNNHDTHTGTNNNNYNENTGNNNYYYNTNTEHNNNNNIIDDLYNNMYKDKHKGDVTQASSNKYNNFHNNNNSANFHNNNIDNNKNGNNIAGDNKIHTIPNNNNIYNNSHNNENNKNNNYSNDNNKNNSSNDNNKHNSNDDNNTDYDISSYKNNNILIKNHINRKPNTLFLTDDDNINNNNNNNNNNNINDNNNNNNKNNKNNNDNNNKNNNNNNKNNNNNNNNKKGVNLLPTGPKPNRLRHPGARSRPLPEYLNFRKFSVPLISPRSKVEVPTQSADDSSKSEEMRRMRKRMDDEGGVDSSSVHQLLREGDEMSDMGLFRYTGRSNPSKVFQLLQNATGTTQLNENVSRPPSIPRARNDGDGVDQKKVDPDDVVDMSYIGNKIPSRTFMNLQSAVIERDPYSSTELLDSLNAPVNKSVKVVRLRPKKDDEIESINNL